MYVDITIKAYPLGPIDQPPVVDSAESNKTLSAAVFIRLSEPNSVDCGLKYCSCDGGGGRDKII